MWSMVIPIELLLFLKQMSKVKAVPMSRTNVETPQSYPNIRSIPRHFVGFTYLILYGLGRKIHNTGAGGVPVIIFPPLTLSFDFDRGTYQPSIHGR